MGRMFSYTTYYRHMLKPLRGQPKGETYQGRFGTFTDKLNLTIHLDPKEHYAAAVEASANLDLTGCGLAWDKGRWSLVMGAPWGVGCKGQPLVPHRDVAHGHRGGLPFGTRLVCVGEPPVGMFKTLYVADRFGPGADGAEDLDRIDLFVGEPLSKRGQFEAEVYPLPGDFSTLPVKAGQQALIKLGFSCGPKGADGVWGKATREAFGLWCEAQKRSSSWEGPANPLCDPEILWSLREEASK